MHSRAEWGAAPSRGKQLGMARTVRGVAVHWPAAAGRLDPAATPRVLRSIQRHHQDGQGWSDIAYQVAVDQAGELWQLRGYGCRSAANGNAAANADFGAILALLGNNEQPTPRMLVGLREAVQLWRRVYPHATRVVGHVDVRPHPTLCPGPALLRAIRSGQLDPAPRPAAPSLTTQGDDVIFVRCDKRGTALLTGPVFVGLGSAAERADADRLAKAGTVGMLTVEPYTWDELDRRSKVATVRQ
jgi:hypothetical protein